MLVNLVGFLVISLVRGACKQAVLIIGVLELFRIDVRFFATPGLGLAAFIELRLNLVMYVRHYIRNYLCRGAFPCRADIRPGGET